LDDEALLRHFQGERGVRFTPVIDDEEIRRERIDGIVRGDFEFNGETHALPDPVPWLVNPSRDVEWHILLHKFHFAVGLGRAWKATGNTAYAQRWAQLLSTWIDVTPVDFIATDVTGRRVQNWIGGLHEFVFTGGAAATIDAAVFRRVLTSLHAQVEHLCENLTPKRNHRTLELLAIFIAGVVFPEFARARDWCEFALRETVANVQADLLIDGVHCELSTDYHHLALRNWLQVRTLARDNGVDVPEAMDSALQRALDFSMHVHAPSGLVPSFSDGDVRGYLALLEQGAALYAREDMRFVATQGRQGHTPDRRTAHFAASGYHVVRSGWGTQTTFADQQHLVFDCGPLGEGNHGHFDALSFELAAHGRALIVDPGRYTYSEAGQTNWRVHFRGTAAHNTVTVDGLNQTRYEPRAIKEASRHASGSVRHKVVGRAPHARLVEAATSPLLDVLHGRCESQAYEAVHDRTIVFVDRRYWIVGDALSAPQPFDAVLNFQLASQAQGATRFDINERSASWQCPGLQIVQPLLDGHHASVEPGWVSPTYGVKHAAPRCVTRAHGNDIAFDSVIVADEEARLEFRTRTVHGQWGGAARALCIRWIEQARDEDLWLHVRDVSDDTWLIDGLRFRGRWCLVRFEGERIARVITHDGAEVEGGGSPLVVRATAPRRG
jgi:uncharacterized heparinase superfamily protein